MKPDIVDGLIQRGKLTLINSAPRLKKIVLYDLFYKIYNQTRWFGGFCRPSLGVIAVQAKSVRKEIPQEFQDIPEGYFQILSGQKQFTPLSYITTLFSTDKDIDYVVITQSLLDYVERSENLLFFITMLSHYAKIKNIAIVIFDTGSRCASMVDSAISIEIDASIANCEEYEIPCRGFLSTLENPTPVQFPKTHYACVLPIRKE